ncbi:uncharacterized protein M6B38_301995 [Iris pallida]|uniref:Uncharacterized protein n=1 Tax=Iris pallida TaxID=29817 RepID=A0AAX6HN12_IRIPA|nr:uncharacterized protein M6B38_301995 [Iris pallida]
MGCASSKGAEVAADDVYRPPPTGVALFDVNSIDEPWLVDKKNADGTGAADEHRDEEEGKPRTRVHLPLLEKLESYELSAPQYSWSEVSKALEDLKPSLHQQNRKLSPPSLPASAAKRRPPPLPPPQCQSRFRSVKENSFLVWDREGWEKISSNFNPRK